MAVQVKSTLKFLAVTIFYAALQPSAFAANELRPEVFQEIKVLKGSLAMPTSEKATLFYFWATWCPDCREKIRGDLPVWAKSSGINIVTVNTDRSESKVREYINKESVELTVVRDDSKALQKALSVYSVPAWAIVRRDGDKYLVDLSGSGSDSEPIMNYLEGKWKR